MKHRSVPVLLVTALAALALATTGVVSASSVAEDGYMVASDFTAAALPGSLTISAPECADPGTTVSIGLSYDEVSPTTAIVRLKQPVNDPATYLAEEKTNVRRAALASTGTSHNFFIDPFIQIEGTAVVMARVLGAGSASTTFEVPCP